MRWRTLLPFALLCGCVLDGELKQELGTTPAALGDGWSVGNPTLAGLHPDSLAKVYRSLHSESRYLNALGLLIAVNGKLVWETYLRSPEDRDTYHHIQSSTKTVTSLAVGVATDSGWVPDLDTTFCAVYPESCPSSGDPRRAITLRHLLTMRSGIDFDNDVFSYEMYVEKPGDPLAYILRKPLYAQPGQLFRYRDADPHLAGAMLWRLAGKDERRIVEDALFRPMGIVDYNWERAPGGQPMAAHGLHLRPRDLLKLAQLGLDSGAWNGRQLVSQEWMRLSLAHQADPDRNRPSTGAMSYGFYWWRLPAIGAASTWGHGGQFAFFLPSRHLAVAMVSLPDVDDDNVGTNLEDLVELLAPILH